MNPKKWTAIYIGCALLGVFAGYVATLIYKPSLIPPAFRIAGLHAPTNILFLGCDVVYEGRGRAKKVRSGSFKGRSDTIMVARLDPFRKGISVLSIPRDTRVSIPGYGRNKINAANALGGVELVKETISELLGIQVDHYVVLNLKGLEAMVDELGGIELEVPKRMRYRDRSAGLTINLHPGKQVLSGQEAIGFVRFRHDELGDIGRVQRQEIFLKAVLHKAMKPESWVAIPKLIDCASRYSDTDLSVAELTSYVTFVKDVPRDNQVLMMLPGTFSDTGDWLVNQKEKRRIVSRFLGAHYFSSDRSDLRLTILNFSSDRSLSARVARDLKEKGYRHLRIKKAKRHIDSPLRKSRIIAQKGNTAEANLVKGDLGNTGVVVNASVGDIESSVTLELGEDLIINSESPDK